MVYFRKAGILSLMVISFRANTLSVQRSALVSAVSLNRRAPSGLQGLESPRHGAGEKRNTKDVGGPFKSLDVNCKFRVDTSFQALLSHVGHSVLFLNQNV